jgi:hypothetical protein
MSQNDDNGANNDLEDAASQGPLPGVEEADLAEREGRDASEAPDDDGTGETGSGETGPGTHGPGTNGSAEDGSDDDSPAGGVVMGAINQH